MSYTAYNLTFTYGFFRDLIRQLFAERCLLLCDVDVTKFVHICIVMSLRIPPPPPLSYFRLFLFTILICNAPWRPHNDFYIALQYDMSVSPRCVTLDCPPAVTSLKRCSNQLDKIWSYFTCFYVSVWSQLLQAGGHTFACQWATYC